jgi:SpoIIAA-like
MLKAEEIDGLFHLEANDSLSEQHHDALVPRFERVAKRMAGTVPMLVKLRPNFAGWEISGLCLGLKFDVRHKDQLGRITIVGDEKLEDWATNLLDPFFRAEVRFCPRKLCEKFKK